MAWDRDDNTYKFKDSPYDSDEEEGVDKHERGRHDSYDDDSASETLAGIREIPLPNNESATGTTQLYSQRDDEDQLLEEQDELDAEEMEEATQAEAEYRRAQQANDRDGDHIDTRRRGNEAHEREMTVEEQDHEEQGNYLPAAEKTEEMSAGEGEKDSKEPEQPLEKRPDCECGKCYYPPAPQRDRYDTQVCLKCRL